MLNTKLLLILSFCFVYAFGASIVNNDPKKVIAKERNGNVKFELEVYTLDTLNFCIIKFPNDKIFELYPKKNITDPNFIPYDGAKCGFQIDSVTLEYIGDYELYSSTTSYSNIQKITYQPLSIVVEERIDMIPSGNITIYPGKDLEFFLTESMENFKYCEIQGPNETYTSKSSDCLLNFQNVTKEFNGTWKFRAVGDIVLYSDVNITIKDIPEINNTDIQIPLGIPANLIMGPEESVYCKAIHPKKHIVTENSGQCLVNIRRVTKEDSGIWDIQVGLIGSMSLIHYKYNFTVLDLGEQNEGEILTYKEVAKDKSSAKIECKLLVKSMESCRIIRDDGLVFIVNEGIGEDRYKYFSNKKEKAQDGIEYVNCGIHIKKPIDLDLKPWKCVIVYEDEAGDKVESGSVINLSEYGNISGNSTTEPELNNEISRRANSTANNSLEIMCSHSSPISYCWFRSPRGVLYTSMPGLETDEYEYFGNGLKMGQCGIRFKSANVNQTGVWLCNVENDRTLDLSIPIAVTVYDTPLVFEYKENLVNDGDSITCKTMDKTPLEYCRFIRPDGYGINPKISSDEYDGEDTDLEAGICKLTLRKPWVVDHGRWRCIGKPHFKYVEYSDSANVEVYSVGYGARVFNAIMITVFTIIIISGLVVLSLMLLNVYKKHREARESRRSNDIIKVPLP